jgi:hypothetical protein
MDGFAYSFKAGLQPKIAGKLHNVIVGECGIPSTAILVQVTRFQVKRWRQPVTHRQVKAVLVKKLTIDIRFITEIDKHLILQSDKHSFGK